MGVERGDKAGEGGAAPGDQRQNNRRQPKYVPGLEFSLTNLPFSQPLAGNDRRGGAEGVADVYKRQPLIVDDVRIVR